MMPMCCRAHDCLAAVWFRQDARKGNWRKSAAQPNVGMNDGSAEHCVAATVASCGACARKAINASPELYSSNTFAVASSAFAS